MAMMFNLIQCFVVWTVLAACLSGCSEPPSLEEAKQLKYKFTLKGTGIDFDVPITYDHSAYVRNQRQWFRPPEARQEVDYIDINALLPDLEPINEANIKEFDTPGLGRQVSAGTTRLPRANWNYFFQNFAGRMKQLPDSPEVPGMLHYSDEIAEHEVFMSHDHPVKDLIRITCIDYKPPPPWPDCKVETLYRDQFYFEYTFWRPYLSQWREIDRKLKALFDQFAENAKQAS